jgi:hypothetical protein
MGRSSKELPVADVREYRLKDGTRRFAARYLGADIWARCAPSPTAARCSTPRQQRG